MSQTLEIPGNDQMIREYRPGDIDQILEIWLSASIKAHNFIAPDFWQSKVNDMRYVYIPASETFIFESEGKVNGFYSLYGDNLAAIFVAPELQGKGIGATLLDDAKNRRKNLQLTVYKENIPSVDFYEKQGFIHMGEQIDEHTGHPELIMEFHS
ncbi:N-acetyltransferase [Marinobacter sp. M1N3S26]|uniref:N-acetyltransferase n=1 Tax=Marinobacter sp. M1N3S26 TaxID=3382299 RepID=UPI00387AF478